MHETNVYCDNCKNCIEYNVYASSIFEGKYPKISKILQKKFIFDDNKDFCDLACFLEFIEKI